MMKQYARQKFSSFGITVPTGWQEPQGDPAANHYKLKYESGQPDMSQPALFKCASMNKVHCDTHKKLTSQFGTFIDTTCSAICSAWDSWQKAASMVGFVVTGPMAMVGKVVGIPWTPLILASGAKDTPQMNLYTTIIATVLGNAWLAYTLSITSAGVAVWPQFNAFPSPVVPPQPGTPVALTLFQQVDAGLKPSVLKAQMVGMLGKVDSPFNGELFEAIATGFNQCFDMWKGTTVLNNIMGAGAVPSCIPPAMPPGPVVGTAFMPPGGFT